MQSNLPLNTTGNNEERRPETVAFSISFRPFSLLKPPAGLHIQLTATGQRRRWARSITINCKNCNHRSASDSIAARQFGRSFDRPLWLRRALDRRTRSSTLMTSRKGSCRALKRRHQSSKSLAQAELCCVAEGSRFLCEFVQP